MNYFTKEELIEIAEYCNWEAHDTGHSDFRRNLRIKIQSMIDSYDEYCNHYWIAEYSCHTVESNPIPNPPPKTVAKCKHCGVTYG